MAYVTATAKELPKYQQTQLTVAKELFDELFQLPLTGNQVEALLAEYICEQWNKYAERTFINVGIHT